MCPIKLWERYNLRRPPLFQTKEGLSTDKAVGFTLKNAEVRDGGSVWRYCSQLR